MTEIADQFQYWLKNRSEKWGAPILEPPDGDGDDSRRDKFVEPYFQNAKPNQVVAILKAREPARILVAIGDKDNDSPHLEYKQRWVNQFNFYLNDPHWGRMFVRMCPYFPFSARVCLNQHHWLAIRMREEGIDFQQCTNAFLKCGNPARLQELADSLTTQDLLKCGQKWLAAFTPFITDKERKQAGCQHRLFFSQVEYCDNLIFHRRAAVDELTQRLLDLNRTIGQPKKITMIFGRKVTKEYKGKLQTVIEDLDLPNPVIRSHYGHGFAKQYVRDDRSAANRACHQQRYDYGVNKDVENLPRLRRPDVRDHRQLSQRPTGHPGDLYRPRATPETGRAHDPPQWKADPRPQARSPATIGGDAFPGALRQHCRRRPVYHGIYTARRRCSGPDRIAVLAGSLRYDLSKLRAKGLVEKVRTLPSLSTGRQGLLDLRGLPQALRKDLRTPHRGPSSIGSQRHQASAATPHTTGPALSTGRRRSRKALRQGRSQNRCLIPRDNENKILVTAGITV